MFKTFVWKVAAILPRPQWENNASTITATSLPSFNTNVTTSLPGLKYRVNTSRPSHNGWHLVDGNFKFSSTKLKPQWNCFNVSTRRFIRLSPPLVQIMDLRPTGDTLSKTKGGVVNWRLHAYASHGIKPDRCSYNLAIMIYVFIYQLHLVEFVV